MKTAFLCKEEVVKEDDENVWKCAVDLGLEWEEEEEEEEDKGKEFKMIYQKPKTLNYESVRLDWVESSKSHFFLVMSNDPFDISLDSYNLILV